ncbi:MAG: hypothetical protein QY306_06210 [Anaerolineales bacterium]|nr:MAG: hypothetical protein QY306_06210 [Anaerolineales bacterium]
MNYFEVPNTGSGDFAFCSDDECPCSGTKIPCGRGYMYVSQAAVDFRKDARSIGEVEALLNTMPKILQDALFADKNNITATLMCEQGARKRNLDLEIAAADAKHWWETGLVPLRATPLAKEAEQLVPS